jgi:hypothetical protein
VRQTNYSPHLQVRKEAEINFLIERLCHRVIKKLKQSKRQKAPQNSRTSRLISYPWNSSKISDGILIIAWHT